MQWYVDSENDELTDHGVLRIARTTTEVARNRPVVRLRPSSDGTALLAVVRHHGHRVSCTGCSADNRAEEWDTRTGRAVDLGPLPGVEAWRETAMDKVGDRVVVATAVADGERTGSLQTWVRDDDGWSERRAQRDSTTRWQDGHPLVQAFTMRLDRGDGAPYALRYAGGTLLTPAQACSSKQGRSCPTISAPGSMLPR